jgi:oligopeptide transport system ATP-binding protein
VTDPTPLLQVDDLAKHFTTRRGPFRTAHVTRAVDGISFQLQRGRTLGLVGESGCGKSTTGRLVLRLMQPTAGRVTLAGRDITDLPESELRPLRRRMQPVFQDPYASLNPRFRAVDIVGEPLRNFGIGDAGERRDRVSALLARVGLNDDHLDRFAHEFSGGQRQRLGIARALALEPELIVCDEAVSALDVSVQAQIINLLRDLQEERGVSYIFITHDLAVASYLCHEIAVMHRGQIVEHGAAEQVLAAPEHAYTRALLAAVPGNAPIASLT